MKQESPTVSLAVAGFRQIKIMHKELRRRGVDSFIVRPPSAKNT